MRDRICVSFFKSWFRDKLQLECRVNDEEMNLCVKAPLLILRQVPIFGMLFICPGRQELAVLAYNAWEWDWPNREDELKLDCLVIVLKIT